MRRSSGREAESASEVLDSQTQDNQDLKVVRLGSLTNDAEAGQDLADCSPAEVGPAGQPPRTPATQSKVQSIDEEEVRLQSMIRSPSLDKLEQLRRQITSQMKKTHTRAVSVITVEAIEEKMQGQVKHRVQRIENVLEEDAVRRCLRPSQFQFDGRDIHGAAKTQKQL